ncbi:hypothetical protein [Geobacter benzoatilyticus]|uniref:hypothetical protein n=1 Tax=Geobacter benzoatilyticus TaxID=2815309 RepID=UPI001F4BFE15|nr:hypothetical protein [Geobacter benzoatilyticus]
METENEYGKDIHSLAEKLTTDISDVEPTTSNKNVALEELLKKLSKSTGCSSDLK